MVDNHPIARTFEARSISVTIDRPYAEAYAFAQKPENFPKWAAGMSSSLRREGDEWHAETPQGDATVTFSPLNEYGVLDHRVNIVGKPEIYIPLRLIANGEGTEVVFTLFRQPGMDDEAFDDDRAAVEQDLAALKRLLENGAR